jgi:signal transduction histidine kinase
LTAEEDSVDLTIRDDGVGFDPAQAARLLNDGHFGLVGMRERAEMGGGRLDLDSRPGHGTTISVAIPPRFVSSFA